MTLTNAQARGRIRQDLRILLVSEVGGIESFAGAARGAAPRDREMWEALHALEVQTKNAVDDHLGEVAEEFSRSGAIAEYVGQAAGFALGRLPERLQFHSLTNGTKAFMPFFRRLEDHFADTPEADFFSYVVAHELAIQDVGKRMLAGSEAPIEKVENLLDGPWARYG